MNSEAYLVDSQLNLVNFRDPEMHLNPELYRESPQVPQVISTNIIYYILYIIYYTLTSEPGPATAFRCSFQSLAE